MPAGRALALVLAAVALAGCASRPEPAVVYTRATCPAARYPIHGGVGGAAVTAVLSGPPSRAGVEALQIQAYDPEGKRPASLTMRVP